MKKSKKSEQKTFFGMPMNWDRKKIFRPLWNPASDELFPPKGFGIGWTINFHALLTSIGFIKRDTASKPKPKRKGVRD